MPFDFMEPINLRLFDGAAGGGEGGGSAGDANGGSAPTQQGNSGDVKNVVYGKQETVTDAVDPAPAAGEKTEHTGVQTTSDTAEDKERAFREMIQGDYKDLYGREVQRIINQRFKETKGLQEQVEASKPVLDMLMQRYGVDDLSQLTAAVENDDAYWSEAADENGMTVEQYKEFQRLQRENQELLRQQRVQRGRQQADAQLQKWYAEADAMKKSFPKFNLSDEVKNPAFLNLLRSGVPVEHAYKVMHYDSLMTDAMQTTAAATERRVADSVRANGQRPRENGTAAQSGFTVKDDVSKLSKKDRAEIARRVARGEKISF